MLEAIHLAVKVCSAIQRTENVRTRHQCPNATVQLIFNLLPASFDTEVDLNWRDIDPKPRIIRLVLGVRVDLSLDPLNRILISLDIRSVGIA
jgi:hypothetical protein